MEGFVPSSSASRISGYRYGINLEVNSGDDEIDTDSQTKKLGK